MNQEVKRYYAGVGSTETPVELRKSIEELAAELGKAGYILRSGGAPGADTFFEAGCGAHPKEIFLPWVGFNGRKFGITEILPEAFDLAAQFHPAWDKCKTGAMYLHARNCHQVLGRDLRTPADFVVCWTPGGKGSGGTGMAIRIAEAYDIPVFDLASEGVMDRFDAYLEKKGLFSNA